jgi:hypothetical protein
MARHAPRAGQVDLGEQPSAMIHDPLVRERHGAGHQSVTETERCRRSYAVSGHVETGTDLRPVTRALDELWPEAIREEPAGERETGDAAADNQDASVKH